MSENAAKVTLMLGALAAGVVLMIANKSGGGVLTALACVFILLAVTSRAEE